MSDAAGVVMIDGQSLPRGTRLARQSNGTLVPIDGPTPPEDVAQFNRDAELGALVRQMPSGWELRHTRHEGRWVAHECWDGEKQTYQSGRGNSPEEALTAALESEAA